MEHSAPIELIALTKSLAWGGVGKRDSPFGELGEKEQSGCFRRFSVIVLDAFDQNRPDGIYKESDEVRAAGRHSPIPCPRKLICAAIRS